MNVIAYPHRSNIVNNCSEKIKIDRMERIANFRYRTPIEHAWNALERRTHIPTYNLTNSYT